MTSIALKEGWLDATWIPEELSALSKIYKDDTIDPPARIIALLLYQRFALVPLNFGTIEQILQSIYGYNHEEMEQVFAYFKLIFFDKVEHVNDPN